MLPTHGMQACTLYLLSTGAPLVQPGYLAV